MATLSLSPLQKIKVQVSRLALTRKSVLQDPKKRGLIEAQINELHRSYLLVKADYEAGKVARSGYMMLLYKLIVMIDEGYFTAVPEIEMMLSWDWGKVR